MADLIYKLEERRQKLHIQTYAILCLLLVIFLSFYGYTKWQQYELTKQGLEQNKIFIASLRGQVSNEKTEADDKKNQGVQLNKEVGQKLKVIFPTTDDYTNLTKQMDIYEGQLSTKTNPFEVSNIDYQNPIQGDTYSVLPMRMNIRSSNDNFTKFLRMVESSGSLKDNVRLMDISSIRLNFENNEQSGVNASSIINFSVQINAYFQK
ncbi:hypothetical protein HZA40_03065 [Candidatus Peregrinibacteria bacterium]|nr:hypothetical protein [Candidatus Peregrinibacteria bacterium]